MKRKTFIIENIQLYSSKINEDNFEDSKDIDNNFLTKDKNVQRDNDKKLKTQLTKVEQNKIDDLNNEDPDNSKAYSKFLELESATLLRLRLLKQYFSISNKKINQKEDITEKLEKIKKIVKIKENDLQEFLKNINNTYNGEI